LLLTVYGNYAFSHIISQMLALICEWWRMEWPCTLFQVLSNTRWIYYPAIYHPIYRSNWIDMA